MKELRISNFEFRILLGGTMNLRLGAMATRPFTTSSTFKVRQSKLAIRNLISEI